MKEQDSRELIQIGNIFIIAEFGNENVCLILKNRDEKAQSIDLFYEESREPGEKPLKYFELPSARSEKVPLPKDLRNGKNSAFE